MIIFLKTFVVILLILLCLIYVAILTTLLFPRFYYICLEIFDWIEKMIHRRNK